MGVAVMAAVAEPWGVAAREWAVEVTGVGVMAVMVGAVMDTAAMVARRAWSR